MPADIYELIDRNDLTGIEAILAIDPAQVHANKGYSQPIHAAASANKYEIVELLISKGADPDAIDQDGRTPLHLSAQTGVDTVKVLLHNNANPNVYDENGYTPFAWAIFGQQDEGMIVAEILKLAGAKIGALEACSLGDFQLFRQIIATDQTALEQVPSKDVLLIMACLDGLGGAMSERKLIIELLLQCNPGITDTALESVAESFDAVGDHSFAALMRNHLRE